MLLKDIWKLLNSDVFPRPSTEVLFNQYRDCAAELDLPDGAKIRRENLRSYLESFTFVPIVLVVGEAAGPWGCRFSGIPFTSERQLVENLLPFKGRKSSLHSPPYSENSASILWAFMRQYHPNFILWNAVPYHPHKKGIPLSIRKPTMSEIKESVPTLKAVVEILRPFKIIALGRTAETALRKIGTEPLYVRHPSQAGATAFQDSMGRIMRQLKAHFRIVSREGPCSRLGL